MALQHWMDSITPGSRTYYRPSRRGANRKDIVLPGRKREGWILHIVLDTSGSMENEFSKILAIIASFCEKMNVDQVHILLCYILYTSQKMNLLTWTG